MELERRPTVLGIDRHSWALAEARWNYRKLGIDGKLRSIDLGRASLPGKGTGIVAAFTVNELDTPLRDRLRDRLIDTHEQGASVLIVEPVSRRTSPWWSEWAGAFADRGGESARWRFKAVLPEGLRLMDKAAHLDHRELTARSLWLGGRRETA